MRFPGFGGNGKNDASQQKANVKPAVQTKSPLKNIENKYCIYHHGVGVQKHRCGTLLCRECLWEYKKCPNCGQPLDIKESPSKKPSRSRASKPRGESLFPKPTRIVLQPVQNAKSTPAPTDAHVSTSAKTVPLVDAGASKEKSSDQTAAPMKIQKRPSDALSVQGQTQTTQVPAKEQEKTGSARPVKESRTPKDETVGTEMDEDSDDRGPDIFDDDSLAPKRRRGFVPSYKKRRHANLQPGDEEEEDEKDKKKWDVRTVPPVPKRRDYESL